ncbi:unnamed protein product [Spirodela intermedia]|uniref:Reverse transcriptase n=1 Tax=Spirodela intermedia TaxID=51605 RepID=A0ABN7EC72_SPIIN|nr:unnamed protein product [Spirodela intermedia]
MLTMGLIQHSHSPFSSSTLFIHKKDDSWHLCVDYCTLNKITILDRFLILVVDELIDELHKATVCSKLDLRSNYYQICVQIENVLKTPSEQIMGIMNFFRSHCRPQKDYFHPLVAIPHNPPRPLRFPRLDEILSSLHP